MSVFTRKQPLSRMVSHANRGFVAAVRDNLSGASWQRCNVHSMRNILPMYRRTGKRPLWPNSRTFGWPSLLNRLVSG
ncbi:MAG: transposase [Lawsonibacter sp.]